MEAGVSSGYQGDLTTNVVTTQADESSADPAWLVVLEKSQLIMTIIGVIANVGTLITLIKNGQVSLS